MKNNFINDCINTTSINLFVVYLSSLLICPNNNFVPKSENQLMFYVHDHDSVIFFPSSFLMFYFFHLIVIVVILLLFLLKMFSRLCRLEIFEKKNSVQKKK